MTALWNQLETVFVYIYIYIYIWRAIMLVLCTIQYIRFNSCVSIEDIAWFCLLNRKKQTFLACTKAFSSRYMEFEAPNRTKGPMGVTFWLQSRKRLGAEAFECSERSSLSVFAMKKGVRPKGDLLAVFRPGKLWQIKSMHFTIASKANQTTRDIMELGLLRRQISPGLAPKFNNNKNTL